jgi:urate oxidase
MVDVPPPSAPKTIPEEGYLAHARYGKDKVRVFRIVREGSWHHVVEYNVTALLEGAIETRYLT